MQLKDTSDKLRGHFSVETYDLAGNLIDTYAEHNLIMLGARKNMAALAAGYIGGGTGTSINKFVLGTLGHNTSYIDPKKEGENGFTTGKTELFSEPNGDFYTIEFNCNGAAFVTDSSPTSKLSVGGVAGSNEAGNIVTRLVDNGNIIQFTFSIGATNANKPGEPIPYTEAGLYAGSTLFAMKTFPVRVKDEDVKFVITWSIIF